MWDNSYFETDDIGKLSWFQCYDNWEVYLLGYNNCFNFKLGVAMIFSYPLSEFTCSTENTLASFQPFSDSPFSTSFNFYFLGSFFKLGFPEVIAVLWPSFSIYYFES